MALRKLALLAVGFCLSGLLLGCGGSSNTPPSSPLSITTSTLPQGVIKVPYNTTLSASGGITPYAWSVASGSLPAGLSLSRAGVLSGTPTVAGGYGISVAVADSEHPPSVANATLGISVNATLQVTTNSLPSGSPNVFYSAVLAAMGGIAPYSWTITQGELPKGLTLNVTSGVISGTPTATGTSNFTVQASDSETPPATATGGLSIVINPPPARNAALFTSAGSFIPDASQLGLQIQSDGSLTLLPSSPETAIAGSSFAPSPTLPLLFALGGSLQTLLVNPDYSLASASSALLPGGTGTYAPPSVDPTGSNFYLPGAIDSSGTTGITIYPGNGSFQVVSNITIPNVKSWSRMVFTPDASLAFIATCLQSGAGSILSFSRGSDGTLTAGPVYALPSGVCAAALTVSPDGKYVADSEVQVYSIASNGTLTAVLSQPFTVTLNGVNLSVLDLTWDSSGTYLVAATVGSAEPPEQIPGGVAVLQFSGSALTETFPPTGNPVIRLQQTGSFIYAMGECNMTAPSCVGAGGVPQALYGYELQNGQLISVPGSPYDYSNQGDMVIY